MIRSLDLTMFYEILFWLLPLTAANVVTPSLPTNESHQSMGNELEPRVRYGTKAYIKDHPYFASLSYCGAVIISNSWVLTAAHCVDGSYGNTENLRLWVGGESESNSEIVYANQVIIHPHYVQKYLHNDIALLKLRNPLQFNNRIQPIKLPSTPKLLNSNYTYVFVGKGLDENGLLSKWLQKSLMKIPDSASNCMLMNPGLSLTAPAKDINQMYLCIKRVNDAFGICSGDSGSPMVYGKVLIGLGSCGYTVRGCSYPEAYLTNVLTYVPWILDVIRKK